MIWGSIISAAQYPDEELDLAIPATAKSAEGFAPKGWEVEVFQEADLNGDNVNDAAIVISEKKGDKRILILAFRKGDHLERTAWSDDVVQDRNEGTPVAPDPFGELNIENGVVVIEHYGGGVGRWTETERYRWQQNKWMLIGTTHTDAPVYDLNMESITDTNLSTGFVNIRHYEVTGEKVTPKHGSFYELLVITTNEDQKIDGSFDVNEWQGYVLRLNTRRQVVRGAQLWKGPPDLSVRLNGVRKGEDIFIRGDVTDNQFSHGDAIRLVSYKGKVIPSKESKIVMTDKGYKFEACYSMKEIVRLAAEGEHDERSLKYFLEGHESLGMDCQFPVEIEVIDVDGTAKRAVLSTKVTGSPYKSLIIAYRENVGVLENR